MSPLVSVQLPTGTTSLPPLGGRLFAAYRVAWLGALALALAAVGYSWFDLTTPHAIWALRLAKSVVLITVSALLFRRRAQDPVAAILALSFLIWIASSSVDFVHAGTAWPALLDRCRFLLFALALQLFPDGEWYPRWTRHVAAAIVATFCLGIAEASGLLRTSLYIPLAISCVLAAISALFASYRHRSSMRQQQQIKWVAFGLVAGILLILSARAGAAIAAQMAMPAFGEVLLEAMFQLGIIVIALGFLTSLLRYRLYDAEAAISRSAAYAGLTLALVGTFAASESIIQTLGQRYFGQEIGDLSGGIAAAIAAVLLTPLHSKISGWAEQHFQRDLTGLKTQLPDLLGAHSGGSSLARLGKAVLPRIEDAVHSVRIALLVDGRLVAVCGSSRTVAQRWIRQWIPPPEVELFDPRDDDLFPLKLALRCPFGSIRGWLLLGPRPDGSFYGSDDLEALTKIAPPLQRTLILVAEREIELARQRRIINGLNRSMAVLSDRLDRVEQA